MARLGNPMGLRDTFLRDRQRLLRTLVKPVVVVAVLAASAYLARQSPVPHLYLLLALLALGVAAIALQSMALGLSLLVLTAATVGFSIGTGTQSAINLAMLLVALLTGVWLVRMFLSKQVRLASSPLNVPLLAFILSSTLSWIASYVVINPNVTLPGNILSVQAGQFAIFVLTAAAFLLTANHPLSETTLKVWTVFLVLAGTVVLLIQALSSWLRPLAGWTGSLYMWPVVLLAAQILFNTHLDRRIRVLGLGVLGLWVYWSAAVCMAWKSGWVPAAIALMMLLLLKSWRLFLAVVVILAGVALAIGPDRVAAVLLASEEYSASPMRWNMWLDVFRLGAQSAVLGLGPANYRYYWQDTHFESLSYEYVNPYAFRRAAYAPPAHNMYADIFAQTGALGLFFFLWIVGAAVWLGWRTQRRRLTAFGQAYASAVFCGFASLAISSFFFADWLVPYVYNIGLAGFRHSVYAWLLLGTLVGLRFPDQVSLEAIP